MAEIVGYASDAEIIEIEAAGYEAVELSMKQEEALFQHLATERDSDDKLIRVLVDCPILELIPGGCDVD